MTTQEHQYPQELLDQVHAAKHKPSQSGTAPYVFRAQHNGIGMVETKILGTFGTLEKANQAILTHFKKELDHFFRDMSIWHEHDRQIAPQPTELLVYWKVDYHGGLGIYACSPDQRGSWLNTIYVVPDRVL
jgi:hypothetical protein